MITIVYAHPLDEGNCAKMLATLTAHLKATEQQYNLIRLHQDGFDPVMTVNERKEFFSAMGVSADPLVCRYQAMLKETDHIVFIFPIWFNEQPAIVKGFFERVCLPGFGYAYGERGTIPLLTNIKKLTVLTSSGAPTEMLTTIFDNMIERQFIRHICETMFGNLSGGATAWINIGSAGQDGFDAYSASVKERF
jgi:putative NADPH-quinone reductase